VAQLLLTKTISALPGTLTPDTVYFVRVGTGFDLYVTNHAGTVVGYKLNAITGPASSTARGVVVFGDAIGTALATAQLLITPDGALQTTGAGQSGSLAGNTRGTGAVDLQTSRNSATRVASGTNSAILGGTGNLASGGGSVVAGGESNVNTGGYGAIPGGLNNTVTATGGLASGQYARANRYGQRVHAAGQFATQGDAQASEHVLRAMTTDATATVLTLDGAAVSAQGRLTLAAGQVIGFRGVLVAETTSAAVVARWNLDGLVARGATAASTRLVGTPAVTQAFADSGASSWSVAVAADTTNGGLTVTVTGAASTTIRWLLVLAGPELSF